MLSLTLLRKLFIFRGGAGQTSGNGLAGFLAQSLRQKLRCQPGLCCSPFQAVNPGLGSVVVGRIQFCDCKTDVPAFLLMVSS